MYNLIDPGRQLVTTPLISLVIGAVLTICLIHGQSSSSQPLSELSSAKSKESTNENRAENIQENSIRPPVLSEEALLRGLDFSHLQQSHGITGLDETLGSGICVLDFNNDNRPDLFAVGGSGHTRFYGRNSWWSQKQGSRLYQNDGRGYFKDVTQKIDLQPDLWGMGCSAADLDSDGFSDLVVTSRDAVYLLHNRGGGRFKTAMLYQSDSGWPTSVAIADINNDDLPDIYVANYLGYNKTAKHFEGISGYRQATPASFQPNFYQGRSNLLFLNKGELTFEESAAIFNLDVSEGRSLSAHWLHANNDAYVDLLIVNGLGSTTQLYINQRGQKFAKADLSRHLDLPSGTRSAAINDFDGDGDADIVLSTTTGESPALLVNTGNEYINATWKQLDSPGKLTGMSSYGIDLVDINNDGYPDLLFGNGFHGPDGDSYYVPQGQPNLLALNDGKGRFTPWIPDPQPFSETLSSRSLVAADFDSDGDSDFVVSNNNGPLQLFVNNTPNPRWIGFDFSSADYLRALKVTLNTNQRALTRFISIGTFLGNRSSKISFALDIDESPASAIIYWRDGSVTRENSPGLDRYHLIRQGKFSSSYGKKTETPFRPLPYKLAIWKIIGGKAESEELARSFLTYEIAERRSILDKIDEHGPETHLPTIKLALEDKAKDIVIRAINLLIRTENDNSLHWLEPLLSRSEPDILCAIADGYRHLYIEEEAAILRKNLGVSRLIRLLEHASGEVQSCALGALGESKSFRPVSPIIQLLDRTFDPDVMQSAYNALGELRRTHSAKTLRLHLTDKDQHRKLELALRKTEGKVKHDVKEMQSEHKSPSNQPPKTAKYLAGSCIHLDNNKLKKLHPKQLASLFGACSRPQLDRWFMDNLAFCGDNYSLFLDNRWIPAPVISTLLRSLSTNPPAGFIDLIHTRIRNNGRYRPVLISSLGGYPVDDSVYKTLEQIFKDEEEPKGLRILAGDILINHNSDLVLSYSEALFYDQ
ncbi:FG-GAP-like repeat-containing protein [Microbulbifer rhizosphaerae]|uniref:Repeat domain-containing protein n=1 Tax=Microbulbifer rhizosphaerae TaxID=1562603 RepID=A0A7W4WFC2_9GAMM|nr:FG-GAP-like repeat-containing protein [Microbulbifer rhizosphaerae]MBB3063167.1 hypothetical protein [Microbulbifer rhizosphaerae]